MRLRVRTVIIGCSFVAIICLICANSNIYNNENNSAAISILNLSSEVDHGFFLERCNCSKHKNIRRSRNSKFKSTCSEEADWYGRGQRVLTYTLHEDTTPKDPSDIFTNFIKGLNSNVNRVKLLYPGWIMRIYSEHELDTGMCKFACLDEVMWCDINQPRLGNLVDLNFRLWRFMVIGDPTVDIFVSRDIDSFILKRERAAVAEWEASNKTFHCTRDVDFHDADMWAGAWGGKNYALDPVEATKLRQQFITLGETSNSTRLDENLLTELIFNKYPKFILAHDSYRCQNPKHLVVTSVPFPTRKKNRYTYVAMNIGARPKSPRCPVDCRPIYGKNWTYC